MLELGTRSRVWSGEVETGVLRLQGVCKPRNIARHPCNLAAWCNDAWESGAGDRGWLAKRRCRCLPVSVGRKRPVPTRRKPPRPELRSGNVCDNVGVGVGLVSENILKPTSQYGIWSTPIAGFSLSDLEPGGGRVRGYRVESQMLRTDLQGSRTSQSAACVHS